MPRSDRSEKLAIGRPLIFIGTSKEGLAIGEALQQQLQQYFEVLLWTQDVFQPSQSTLADLLNTRNRVDYAAFVLTADDIRRSRRKQSVVPRDNLIFELGLFMGALGAERVFAIAPKRDRPTLPSDFLGITTLDYYEPEQANWQAGIGPVATKLKNILEQRRRKNVDIHLVDGGQWSFEYSGASPLNQIFLNTNQASQRDLLLRLEAAKKQFTAFGLTRNFYMTDAMKGMFREKVLEIPVKLFLMDPGSESRRDRYRIEPLEAALEDAKRFKREMLKPFASFQEELRSIKRRKGSFEIYTYNFPCSFAIELIDDSCRVMLYGHNKRGTEGPILLFRSGTPYFDYFVSQIKWLEMMAAKCDEPWSSRGLSVCLLNPTNLD